MKEYKDPSNQRIMAMLSEVVKFMNDEGRGFIFCPMVQDDGEVDHTTMAAVHFGKGDGKLGEDEIVRFWATLTGLVTNVNLNIPEDERENFVAGFIAFVRGTAELNFPSVVFGEEEK